MNHKYAMVNRPIGIGCNPKDGMVGFEERPPTGKPHHDMARHGIAVYNRKLTDHETKQFEMAPILEGHELDEFAKIVAKKLEGYAAQYVHMAEKKPDQFESTLNERMKKASEGYPPSVGDLSHFAKLVVSHLKKINMTSAANKAQLPQAHYGSADKKPIDWRKHPDQSKDDDEELEKTPRSIVKLLGFDPKKLFGAAKKKTHASVFLLRARESSSDGLPELKIKAAPISRAERGRFREQLMALDPAFSRPASTSSTSLLHFDGNRMHQIIKALEAHGWKTQSSENGVHRLLKNGRWPLSVFTAGNETRIDLSQDDKEFFSLDMSEVRPALAKIAKNIMPAGFSLKNNAVTWTKKGGGTGGASAIGRCIDRATAIGFKLDSSGLRGSEATYEHKDGWRLELSSREGLYSINLTYTPQRGR